jgi:hypothetical protein
MALARDDAAAAEQAFGQSLVIFERLTALDPGNIVWQQNLAAAHSRVGEVALARDDAAAAEQAFAHDPAIVEEIRAWLRDHLGDTGARRALVVRLRAVPVNPSGEVIEETRAWLRDHPGATSVREGLLALVREVPGFPGGEVIEKARAWLREHPEDSEVRAALLALVQAVPGSPAAAEVIEEAQAWLRDNPHDSEAELPASISPWWDWNVKHLPGQDIGPLVLFVRCAECRITPH